MVQVAGLAFEHRKKGENYAQDEKQNTKTCITLGIRSIKMNQEVAIHKCFDTGIAENMASKTTHQKT